jgi:hypothetical protein
MTTSTSNPPPASPKSKEHWLVYGLCLLAVVHVFIFSAAFPFFNVDEMYHFDLTVKYSHLHFPQKPEYLADESLRYIVVYSSWEYIYTNDTLSAPPWKQPLSVIEPILLSRERRWQPVNYETLQPPLYYLVSGAWWQFWSAIGFHDGFLLYLLRFLNILTVVALVWLAWLAARLIFPDQLFIRIAVPALLAFMPQTIFYSVNNDAFSPLCFGAAFVCLIKFQRDQIPSALLGLATGLMLALTFLSKTSNLPLLAAAGLFIAWKIWNLLKIRKLQPLLLPLGSLFFSAGIPMVAWMIWCKICSGHFISSSGIAQQLGWTIKPFSQWWQHPIFTPHGFWIFLSGNLATFWQGETSWHGKGQLLALPLANILYTLVSITFLAGALFYLKKAGSPQRLFLVFAFAELFAVFAFFWFLSIIYDFHDCFYPSREHPYFTSGRLLLGALIPFLLLFAYGMDRMLDRFGKPAKWYALAILISTMLTLEIVTDWPVFSSQYNWFNM